MKQKDITLIIVVVFVAGIFALLFSNLVISSPKNRQEKVEIVDAITSEFVTPDQKYFNDKSVDPTKVIQIGESTNNKPFNGDGTTN
jgi:hypothetical protein